MNNYKTWDDFFRDEREKDYFKDLWQTLEEEYASKSIYPKREDLFSCFSLCPIEKIKVVIIGQDPYHQNNQAHGLSFSVLPHVKIPPSLRNIYKELEADLEVKSPSHGYLVEWAKQGVFLMNTTWSVEEGKPGSHKKIGWQTFTKHVLQVLDQNTQPLVFILWGNHAIKISEVITNPKHYKIKSSHPSPLGARHGFFGSRPFSKANHFLKENGLEEIQWALSEPERRRM